MNRIFLLLAFFTLLPLMSRRAAGDDWARFRGPHGSATATDSPTIALQWSPSANLGWKIPLPGPGCSSPIIVGDRVLVTAYSGYGLDRAEPGDLSNLVRHLVCVDLRSGEKLWQRDVPATMPEDPYTGIGVTAHGYASHTPVSDGTNVYAFFGKSGVHAFDLQGNPQWTADVGQESDPTNWGSSSSPVVFDDIVIITASAESQAIVGLDAATGKELWRSEAAGLDGMWGTPTLVTSKDGRTDLVMCVAKEMWGLDPRTGKLRWYADATQAEGAYSSIVANGETVYAMTGRGGGSIAITSGGDGDVSDSMTLWEGSDSASFSSPVSHNNRLYCVARNILTVVDQETGEKQDQIRLDGAMRTGGRFGSLDYPSPVVVENHLFYLNGSGQMFVFDLSGDTAKQIAVNRVTVDQESFGGSPAISNGRMILRSSDHLYCVIDKNETVDPQDNQLAAAETDLSTASGENRHGRYGSGERDRGERDGGDSSSGSGDASRRGGRPGGGGGASRGGGSRGRTRGEDTRPDRPQRPAMAD